MILKIKSLIIKILLIIRDAKIGRNFLCKELPTIESSNFFINLDIKDNVIIKKKVELFFRKYGEIKIHDNVKIDSGVRLLVSNNSKLVLQDFTKLGKNTIINAGANIVLGKKCLVSANCIIQSSSHIFNKREFIQDLGHTNASIIIDDDVWIGANSIILKGINLKKGTIIGALSKINFDTNAYTIYSGNPAVEIKKR